MQPWVVTVWLLSAMLLSGGSSYGQNSRDGFGGGPGITSSSPARSGASRSQPPTAISRSRAGVPNRAVQSTPNQPQFFAPAAIPAQTRTIERRAGASAFAGKFGPSRIEHWRWLEFRRHPRFFRRHPHFWRPWSFFVIDVPGYYPGYYGFSTAATYAAPSLPVTPYVAGNGWIEYTTPGYPLGSAQTAATDRLAPFDPTPPEIVERMLALAGVKPTDVVYDLGAGDGRVVVAAARNYGATAVGVEADAALIKLARENVRRQRVEDRVEIRQQQLTTIDLTEATVVTLYLSPEANLALRPKLLRELRPGARVVSYAFDMAEWQPKIAESYRDAGGERHMLYLWQVSDPLTFSN